MASIVDCKSRPSTFAQAAKLRRMAATKEKELLNCEFNIAIVIGAAAATAISI